MGDLEQLLPGVWSATAEHPDWTEEEGGDEGWDPVVTWYAVATGSGLVLVDPLVSDPDWDGVDQRVAQCGGCVGIVRTIHWHERSVATAAERYGADVWAMPPVGEVPRHPFDHAIGDGDELWDGIRAFAVHRDDELALWLPAQAALLFADAMLRRGDGTLRVCPASWTQPASGGRDGLLAALDELTRWPARHVLVCHGPTVLGDGVPGMREALAAG